MAENEPKVFRQLAVDFYRRLKTDGVVKGGLAFRENRNVRHAGGKPITYTLGFRYVTMPIAPESGVSTDWQTDPRGRPGFLVNFQTNAAGGALTPAAEAALQAHATLLARWLEEKQIESVFEPPPGQHIRDSAILLFAADRAAVEALVRTDPAIQAGVLAYEIVPAED